MYQRRSPENCKNTKFVTSFWSVKLFNCTLVVNLLSSLFLLLEMPGNSIRIFRTYSLVKGIGSAVNLTASNDL
jgi:hypothetical protein